MSVSGIWPRSAGVHHAKDRSSAPPRGMRGESARARRVERRVPFVVSWLLGSAVGALGACAFELAARGRERALILLGCAGYAAVALLGAWMRSRRAVPEQHALPPKPASPLPDPWSDDTEPALPRADSDPTFRP